MTLLTIVGLHRASASGPPTTLPPRSSSPPPGPPSCRRRSTRGSTPSAARCRLLAAPRVDAISAQLAALAPQLAAVPAGDPTALELNRLLGKHLPELVARYEKVPEAQRKMAETPGGPTIERQLADGLGLIEAELARVNDQLGKDDRDAFAVQGKFLETRYGKDGGL